MHCGIRYIVPGTITWYGRGACQYLDGIVSDVRPQRPSKAADGGDADEGDKADEGKDEARLALWTLGGPWLAGCCCGSAIGIDPCGCVVSIGVCCLFPKLGSMLLLNCCCMPCQGGWCGWYWWWLLGSWLY